MAKKGTKISTPSGTKMPKPKKQPDAFGKPSLFFKTEYEEFAHVKHPTLAKLRDLLVKSRSNSSKN